MDRGNNPSGDATKLTGRVPASTPPRVLDFEELDRHSIDVLVDAIKYIATTAGIVMAIYSQSIQEYIKPGAATLSPPGRLLILSPLLAWFLTIVATVFGIFPKEYRAESDFEKERAVGLVRTRKRRWLTGALVLFLLGFSMFFYSTVAQIWRLFPFGLSE